MKVDNVLENKRYLVNFKICMTEFHKFLNVAMIFG